MSATKTTTKPKKKKKPQGKLDHEKIFRLYTKEATKGEPKLTKIRIAEECGSLASLNESKIQAVNQVINSSQFQLKLEQHREQQRIRALNRVKKAEAKLDYDLMAKNQGVLGNFIIANERLSQESVKQSSDKETEIKRMENIDLLSLSEIEAKREEIQSRIDKLSKVIDSELIE